MASQEFGSNDDWTRPGVEALPGRLPVVDVPADLKSVLSTVEHGLKRHEVHPSASFEPVVVRDDGTMTRGIEISGNLRSRFSRILESQKFPELISVLVEGSVQLGDAWNDLVRRWGSEGGWKTTNGWWFRRITNENQMEHEMIQKGRNEVEGSGAGGPSGVWSRFTKVRGRRMLTGDKVELSPVLMKSGVAKGVVLAKVLGGLRTAFVEHERVVQTAVGEMQGDAVNVELLEFFRSSKEKTIPNDKLLQYKSGVESRYRGDRLGEKMRNRWLNFVSGSAGLRYEGGVASLKEWGVYVDERGGVVNRTIEERSSVEIVDRLGSGEERGVFNLESMRAGSGSVEHPVFQILIVREDDPLLTDKTSVAGQAPVCQVVLRCDADNRLLRVDFNLPHLTANEDLGTWLVDRVLAELGGVGGVAYGISGNELVEGEVWDMRRWQGEGENRVPGTVEMVAGYPESNEEKDVIVGGLKAMNALGMRLNYAGWMMMAEALADREIHTEAQFQGKLNELGLDPQDLLGNAYMCALPTELVAGELGMVMMKLNAVVNNMYDALQERNVAWNEGELKRMAKDVMQEVALCRLGAGTLAMTDTKAVLQTVLEGLFADQAREIARAPRQVSKVGHRVEDEDRITFFVTALSLFANTGLGGDGWKLVEDNQAGGKSPVSELNLYSLRRRFLREYIPDEVRDDKEEMIEFCRGGVIRATALMRRYAVEMAISVMERAQVLGRGQYSASIKAGMALLELLPKDRLVVWGGETEDVVEIVPGTQTAAGGGVGGEPMSRPKKVNIPEVEQALPVVDFDAILRTPSMVPRLIVGQGEGGRSRLVHPVEGGEPKGKVVVLDIDFEGEAYFGDPAKVGAGMVGVNDAGEIYLREGQQTKGINLKRLSSIVEGSELKRREWLNLDIGDGNNMLLTFGSSASTILRYKGNTLVLGNYVHLKPGEFAVLGREVGDLEHGVHIQGVGVSRKHLTLVNVGGGKVLLWDHGSTNGTRVTRVVASRN